MEEMLDPKMGKHRSVALLSWYLRKIPGVEWRFKEATSRHLTRREPEDRSLNFFIKWKLEDSGLVNCFFQKMSGIERKSVIHTGDPSVQRRESFIYFIQSPRPTIACAQFNSLSNYS